MKSNKLKMKATSRNSAILAISICIFISLSRFSHAKPRSSFFEGSEEVTSSVFDDRAEKLASFRSTGDTDDYPKLPIGDYIRPEYDVYSFDIFLDGKMTNDVFYPKSDEKIVASTPMPNSNIGVLQSFSNTTKLVEDENLVVDNVNQFPDVTSDLAYYETASDKIVERKDSVTFKSSVVMENTITSELNDSVNVKDPSAANSLRGTEETITGDLHEIGSVSQDISTAQQLSPAVTNSVDFIVGGFHIIEVDNSAKSRKVRIYWVLRNLFDNWRLRVTQFFKNKTLLSSENLSSWSRHFTTVLPFDETELSIECINVFDVPLKAFIARVPDQNEILEAPKVISVDFGNGNYRLYWNRPNHQADVTSYTVFWGDTIDYVNGGFLGILEYEYLLKNATFYGYHSTIYKARAISVNSATSSSGLVRPLKEIMKKEFGAFEPTPRYRVNASSIAVSWSLQHPEIVEILGKFNMYYVVECCAVDARQTNSSYRVSFPFDEGATANVIFGDLSENTLYAVKVHSVLLLDEIFHSISSEITIQTQQKELPATVLD